MRHKHKIEKWKFYSRDKGYNKNIIWSLVDSIVFSFGFERAPIIFSSIIVLGIIYLMLNILLFSVLFIPFWVSSHMLESIIYLFGASFLSTIFQVVEIYKFKKGEGLYSWDSFYFSNLEKVVVRGDLNADMLWVKNIDGVECVIEVFHKVFIRKIFIYVNDKQVFIEKIPIGKFGLESVLKIKGVPFCFTARLKKGRFTCNLFEKEKK